MLSDEHIKQLQVSELGRRFADAMRFRWGEFPVSEFRNCDGNSHQFVTYVDFPAVD